MNTVQTVQMRYLAAAIDDHAGNWLYDDDTQSDCDLLFFLNGYVVTAVALSRKPNFFTVFF